MCLCMCVDHGDNGIMRRAERRRREKRGGEREGERDLRERFKLIALVYYFWYR